MDIQMGRYLPILTNATQYVAGRTKTIGHHMIRLNLEVTATNSDKVIDIS